ncbi:head-tail adaptor [Cognatiyoonia koreensis]|uniref:Head-tail adaptor n=1 Tax=Cognatiyoonia koreensis TaxID=364200 RepID=A0A1I0NTX4_9RHOB|nr:head-tail adaptor protein [Cognatiyoonia koreensis]SEW04353.1 head-tail adaptor [Cognatiyoonia koreensis]
MKTPHLNRRLKLETQTRVSDDAGGFTVVWDTVGTLWAQIVPGSGRELAAHNLPRSRVPLRIVVRSAPVGSDQRPTPGQRFREGERLFEITAVTEVDRFARYLTCHAEEEVTT